MSTKTTFKRIALVAVAALGFGVLSVVPSQAAAGAITLTVEKNGTARLDAAAGAGETSTGIIFTASSLLTAGNADSITVSFIATGVLPTGAVGNPAIMTFLESTTASSGTIQSNTGAGVEEAYSSQTGDSVTAGTAITITKKEADTNPQIVSARFAIQLDSTTATRAGGTYNYLIIAEGYSAGVKDNSLTKTAAATITIAAAAAVVPAGANATAYIHAGSGNLPTTLITDSVTAGSNVVGTVVGKIRVSNFSTTGAVASDTITVVMTGAGYLTTTTGTGVTGRSFVITNEDVLEMSVIADGTSGVGTITITTVAGASFVKKATFFDTKPVTATAAVAKAFIKAGATTTDVFAITVKDTLGNAVTDGGVTVTAAATDTTTTVGGAATCAWNVTGAAYHCSITGKAPNKFGPVAYTITVTGTGLNVATKITTTATTTFADNIATKAVLAGPTTGTPGEKVDYTLTLTEKNGYPVADQTYGVGSTGGVLFSATAADRVVSGWSIAPFSASDSFTSKSGVITSKGTLPIAGVATGSWTLVGNGLSTAATDAIDKTIGKTKLTVTTNVANPGVDAATDAANEATDAANAATDAALAAAEAADAATSAAQEASDAVAALSESVTQLVTGLQSQIKALAKVVNKIAKQTKK